MRKPKENSDCPYCLSPVEDEESVRCPKCGIVHHADCWKANERCSVYGCDGWSVWNNETSRRLAPETEALAELDAHAAKRSARKDEVVLCISCGRRVKRGRLLCRRCSPGLFENYLQHYFQNCFGPSMILLCGFAGVVTVIVRALV